MPQRFIFVTPENVSSRVNVDAIREAITRFAFVAKESFVT